MKSTLEFLNKAAEQARADDRHIGSEDSTDGFRRRCPHGGSDRGAIWKRCLGAETRKPPTITHVDNLSIYHPVAFSPIQGVISLVLRAPSPQRLTRTATLPKTSSRMPCAPTALSPHAPPRRDAQSKPAFWRRLRDAKSLISFALGEIVFRPRNRGLGVQIPSIRFIRCQFKNSVNQYTIYRVIGHSDARITPM